MWNCSHWYMISTLYAQHTWQMKMLTWVFALNNPCEYFISSFSFMFCQLCLLCMSLNNLPFAPSLFFLSVETSCTYTSYLLFACQMWAKFNTHCELSKPFRLVQFPYFKSFSPDLLRISVNLPFSLELFFLSVQTQCFLCLPCILPLLIFFFLHVDCRPSSIHTANLS